MYLPEIQAIPFHLSAEEKSDPQIVLDDFFDFASVCDARRLLGEWLLAAFYAQDGHSDEYIHLCHRMERLLEACWLLQHKK